MECVTSQYLEVDALASKGRVVIRKNAGKKVKIIVYTTDTRKARLDAFAKAAGFQLSPFINQIFDDFLERAELKD